ncbi:carboxypeptidase-like regulatory domain-containing protein [Fulvivirga ligni]|uniref:carboxypeptidase-like regulatory domain-containing protein n=1 Tax=Fulvivirga ligni TaxID=2904246 RepID=UPI001F31B1FB|nr:carboxypeptidase-like regulatory domain-containing protein [Fulvivirga ligni]UII19442.1 carboxypeptidase-like regulatory domain-containing protein [Fulvivirga ligni]
MKKHITLSVENPCNENWSEFTPTKEGGYCAVCERNVVDFTSMTDVELKDYFLNHKGGKVCGMFRGEQLKTYELVDMPKINNWLWVKAAVIGLSVLAFTPTVKAQTNFVEETVLTTANDKSTHASSAAEKHWIKGVVKDGEGQAVPGANIILKGSEIGTVADKDGRFEFPQALEEGDILLFSFIGFETEEYKVPNKSVENLEIEMKITVSILGEVVVGKVYQEPKENLWDKIKNIF